MRAGIEAEDEKRRLQKESQNQEAQETKKRLEKNQQEYELQQKLAADLLSKNQQ